MTYDYDGRLTSLTRGAQWEAYQYNGAGARTRITNESQMINVFNREGAGVLSPITRDSNAQYTPGLSERRNWASTFQHSGLKNVDAQSGATGSMTGAREYDAFGGRHARGCFRACAPALTPGRGQHARKHPHACHPEAFPRTCAGGYALPLTAARFSRISSSSARSTG